MNTTPIEFMAWDVEELKIRRVVEINYPEWIVCVYDDYENTQCERNSFKNEGSDRFMLMQLTALRSINDEPIYNHMIVKNECDDLFEVDMFDYMLMCQLDRMQLQIIGNRFQHSELWEMCK